MKEDKRLQLGDLIDLKGLKKPEEGVVTVELGGADVKPEDVGRLEAGMSDLAENLERDRNVTVSAVTDLVKAINNVLERKLLPEVAEKLLETLQTRFENPENMRMRHPGLEWTKVQAKLEKNPEKLWSLNEMEKTKGEPDVVGFDEETGEFIFMDCSVESPGGRRNCVYDIEGEIELKKLNPSANYKSNAVSMAALMGVDILNEREYRELQTKGEFDKGTWSWIRTPIDKRTTGVALDGIRGDYGVFVRGGVPGDHNGSGGWRAVLRLK